MLPRGVTDRNKHEARGLIFSHTKRSKNESQCFGGIAVKHEVFVSGIKTLVRLWGSNSCSDESQCD